MIIGVIGGNRCDHRVASVAEELGRKIAGLGAKLVCGGLKGVMEAASKGAREAGGQTIGILPGDDKKDANPYIDISIPTGLGYARNILVVRTADVIVALPGEYGTLSEIALALQIGKPVVGINTWDIPGVIKVMDVGEAMRKVKALLDERSGER